MKNLSKTFILSVIILLCVFELFAFEKIDNKYLIRTFIDENGNEIDEIIVPGRPPEFHREPAIELPDPASSRAINILSNVPAFDWSYGCSATSAAIMAGHYDNMGYPNMYAGPTNGGICPMSNSSWGVGECPLSATHQGFDGLATLGHVDDYWFSYGSTADPYFGNWPEHGYADCTADYMGTNQYHNWLNTDGSTTFYFNTGGAPLYDYTACEPTQKDGCHGLREFIESRGYNIVFSGGNYQNYSQYINPYHSSGFTYNQFKAEIDAGYPVLIQVEGHTMLGFGYDDSSNLVYIHDTWDHLDHTMTWGGYYSGMLHYGVGVFVLESLSDPDIAVNPMSFSSTLELGQTNTHFMDITNVGDPGSILTYSLSHGYTDGMDNITGSYVICSHSSFTAGETVTWTFTVYNASTDVEWLTDVYIDFPPDVTVNSGTNFVGGTGGDLVYDGTTGNGAYLHWYDNNGGWGNIYGGEFASADVSVSIHSGFVGDITLDYQINGDVYGSPPHVVNGSINLSQQITENWLSYVPTSGSCNYNETDTINITFDATGLIAGTFTANIFITHNAGSPILIPCALTVINPPDIDVIPTFLIENLNTGDTSTQVLTINNEGGEVLIASLHIEETDSRLFNPRINVSANTFNPGNRHIESNSEHFNEIMPDGDTKAFENLLSQISDRTLIFSDHMESGINGWTTQLYGGSTDDLWHQTNINYNSAYTSWWCGIEGQNNYDTGNRINTAVISPLIDLTGVTDPVTLAFYENYETETSYDYCMVDVTTDGGANWTHLRGFAGSGGSGTAPSGSSGGWILSILDLTPYIGNSINIRFYFDTCDGIAQNYPGWFFDDVLVTTDNPSVPWLSVNPNNVTIAAFNFAEIQVGFDAGMLTRGTYTADIVIDSNDPDDPQVIVPVTLTVNNNAPTINLPDDFTYAEDGTLVVDFDPYIDDIDGDPLTLSVAGNTNVTVDIIGSIVTFGAVQDWFGTEILMFVVNDGQTDATAADVVDVIVTPVNDPPILNITGTLEADEDLPSQTYDFSGYCSQTWGETDVLTLSATGSNHIDVTVTDFDVVFESNTLNWNGTENVTFYLDDDVADGGRYIVSQVISVTINPVNDPPTIALPASFTFTEDGTLVEDFTPYINDVDGDPLTLSVLGNTNVTVDIVVYTVTFGAVQDWFGSETLTFTVDDGQMDATASDDVDVIVTPVNDPPILNITGTFEADEDLPSQTYNFIGYCSQTWGETDVLTLSATGSAHIDVTVTDFDVVFESNTLNWNGTENVTFYLDDNVADGRRDVVSQTISVTINPVNDPPTIVLPDNFTFEEDGTLVEDFTPYINDVDGDPLTLSVLGNINVTVSITGSIVTFGTVQDWFGTETLTFTVDDEQTDATASDNVDVIVTPVNDPPILNITGTFETDEDLPSQTYDFSGYCSQTYGETDVLTLSAAGSNHIDVTVTDFDAFFESNTLNWNGTEDVTFYLDDNVADGRRDVVSQTIPVTINPVNDPPTIVLPDNFTFEEDGSLVEDFTPYLNDVDGDPLTLTVAGNINVTVDIVGYVVVFGAVQDWFGTETLTFTVDDEQTDATASDNVDVIVTPVNDPPILNITGTFETDEDLPSQTYDFSGYCSQTYGETDVLTLSATGSVHIDVTVTDFDAFFESNTLNWNGTEDVTFYLDDNIVVRGRDIVSQTIPVTINPVNDPPTIVLPDDFTFAEDSLLVVDFAQYISDVDEDSLSLSVSGNINVTINIDSTIVTFGAIQDWFGTETLTFTINDNQTRATAEDSVDVIVTPVNDPPVLISWLPEELVFTVEEDSIVTFYVEVEDIDSELNYTWFVSDTLQTEITDTFIYEFSEVGEFEIKSVVSDEEYNIITIWNITVEPGVGAGAILPALTRLYQNYPNPFNPTTTIKFDLVNAGKVTVKVYNIKGELVRTLYSGNYPAGKHDVIWNGKDNSDKTVSSGVYFYHLKIKNYSSFKKAIMLK